MKKALMLTGIYWNETLQRHQQFAEYLVSCGYQVFFVEHIVSSKFTFSKIVTTLLNYKKTTFRKHNEKIDNIHTISSNFLPPSSLFALINRYKINKLIGKVGTKFDVVFNYLPIYTTRYIIEQISYHILIYDCVRNFVGWGGYYKTILREENWLIAKCDKIFTDSYYLTDNIHNRTSKPVVQFMPIANTMWIAGCQKTKNIDVIKHIAYFGSVAEHLDLYALKKLAENGYVIHIWGDIMMELDFEYIDHGYENNLTQLAKSIIDNADAIILPYKGNMDGVIPAKMMQCLSTKLPVYISNFYDSVVLHNFVYNYADFNELLGLISTYDKIEHLIRLEKIDEMISCFTESKQYLRFVSEIQK